MRLNKKNEWIYDNGEKAIWWNPYEGNIIGYYIEFLGALGKWPKYQQLEFKDGTILYVEFEGYGDSDNDLELNDPDYEEYYEFYFKILKVKNKAEKCKWRKNQTIFLNYHNFPIKWEKLSKEEIEKLK